MYVISPWSRGGWVNSQVFDHTSIGMFLEKRFGVTIKAISKWHRAVSGDLTSAFDFKTPNLEPLPRLPDMSGYRLVESQSKRMPIASAPDKPQEAIQEPGIRHSRPIPYALHVTMRRQGAERVGLSFLNAGAQGAVFHVYDKHRLKEIPRRYTVEAKRTLDDDYWLVHGDNRSYNLQVYGPGGFVRYFSGRLLAGDDAHVDVHLSYDIENASIVVIARNLGISAVPLIIRWNAYITEDARHVVVNNGASIEQRWNTEEHGNWYDISIESSDFNYRFAGRMETGKPSISDPAI